MPLIETKGAASAQGFGEFSKTAPANWIEDCFSCFLYTGNGSTQTITNGIDLAGKGGLVWIKSRSNATENELVDTQRAKVGSYYDMLRSNSVNAVTSGDVTAFNTDGFTVGNNTSYANNSPYTYASWTFRKQAKFFDVVTYTGTGTGSLVVNHSLGSKPGFIVVKRTDSTGDWWCWARASDTQVVTSGGIGTPFALNRTNAGSLTSDSLLVGAADATTFTPAFLTGFSNSTDINGATYVAYLFAHNAGGFGLTGTDNVISCGSYTGTGAAGNIINLGYEPQWILIKNISQSTNWVMFDNMRGMPATESLGSQRLVPNSSAAEANNVAVIPTATGFNPTGSGTFTNSNGNTFIYIAIRRGPMKTPTSGTSVFTPVLYTGTSAAQTIACANTPDFLLVRNRSTCDNNVYTRIIGANQNLYTNLTLQQIDQGASYGVTAFGNASWNFGLNANNENLSGAASIGLSFSRAPGFFDVVCWTGTDTYAPQKHNLGVVPELVIQKTRSVASNWNVTQGGPTGPFLFLQSTVASGGANGYNPTATTFDPVADDFPRTYVAYLFASCPGVSKVGSYTGTGAAQTINCGFTGGARFVLIKRTDDVSSWFVWDTARGMVAGTDPRLFLNNTLAEVNQDFVFTTTGGFQIVSTDPVVNASGGTYIFLAIA